MCVSLSKAYSDRSVRTLAGGGPTTDLSGSTAGAFIDNVPLREARFYDPQQLVIDPEGNVILADHANNRVRMLCLDHLETTPSLSCTRSEQPSPSNTSSITYVTHSVSMATNRSASINTATASTRTRSSAAPSSSHSLRVLPLSSSPNPISRLVSSEEAARAVAASGAAAAALAGIAASTSMGHATRMGALMRSIQCAFAAGELEPPSLVELPVQWSIGSHSGPVESHAGSALLTSVVLVVLPLSACAVVNVILSSCGVLERPSLRSLQCNVVSRYCLLSMAFFAPNVLLSATVVVGRGGSTDAVAAAVCAVIVPLLLGCVAGQRALAMDVDVVPLNQGKYELQNRVSSSAFVETFGGLIDGCRDPMLFIVRVCFLEDAVASLALSFLSGVSLSTTRCEWVAVAMLAVCAFHLLHVVWVRPLRSKIESAMNCALCGSQLLMAILCFAIASGADNANGILMGVLGVVALVQNVSFFAQAAIFAVCACVSEGRKHHVALACDSPDNGVTMGNHALLTAPINEGCNYPPSQLLPA